MFRVGQANWNGIRALVSLGKRLETHCFLCSGCDNIHTVEKKPLGSGANHY